MQVPIRPFKHFCCSVYRLAIKRTEKIESKNPTVCRVQLSLLTGVRLGCVVAPDSFATDVDWVMERATGRGMNGVAFGQDAYTDLDFADDISLLAELLSLLIPVLEAFAEEAAAIGLKVNWDKALGTHQPDTETLDVYGAPGCSC